MRNSIIIILALMLGALIVTAAPVLAARNDRDWNYGRVTLTGVVVDTDSRRSELTVKFERYDTYKVRSDEANIRYSGRSYSFRDIRKGDTVRISGDISSNGYMDASTIDVIDRNSRDDYRDDRGRDRNDRGWVGSTVIVPGNVRSVDRKRGLLDVDTDRGRLQIIAGKYTDIREMGRKRAVDDIRVGDRIVINGRVETYTSIRARAIDIGETDGRRGSPIDSVLIGEVSGESTMWDRDIKVRTPLGERTVKIPQGVDIIRAGRGISVHDINKGETIRALGSWSGDTFVANQVDITLSRNNEDGYNGKVDRINYDNREFMLNFRGKRYYVEAKDAEIVDNGRRISFRDLKNGQDVWITGDVRGDTIYADRIERGGRDNRDYDRGTEYRPISYNR